jgi:NTP pyrophosphatase (non-canonical NTP hydrolase)
MAKKRVTIDHLAAMMANGLQALHEEMGEAFRAVREHLGHHGQRLDGIESELKDHRVRLDRIERKLDNSIERVDDHSVRLQRLERPRKA